MSNSIFTRQSKRILWSYLSLMPKSGLTDSVQLVSRRGIMTTSTCQKEKKLFTPGPLGTSPTVKQAMLTDFGSRDIQFIDVVKKIRAGLLRTAGVSNEKYTCVPMQGSGTFAIESVFQSLVPRSAAKVLILENGVYGQRMKKICDTLDIPCRMASYAEDTRIDLNHVEDILKEDNSFCLVSIVHCETSSGAINQVQEVGQLVKKYIPDCTYFVDAMSSFGGIPLDFELGNISVLVSSANKCLQGVPGFSFIIVEKDKLSQSKGISRSLSLDLFDQCTSLDKTTQFRFTPPTHAMLAFSQALDEFEEEGGIKGRTNRYQDNCRVLWDGMSKLGFRTFLDKNIAGSIITSYFYPKHPNFNFTEFYNRLNDKGDVIYPGKLVKADCFRVGTIGHLFPSDVANLVSHIEDVCKEMAIPLPIQN